MKHGFIKVAAAAPEIRVADPMFNADAVIRAMDEHARLGVKVLVFPELTLTGATCGDLFYQNTLLAGAAAALEKVVKASEGKDMLVFVGLPVAQGAKVYDAAAAVCNGELLGVVPASCPGDKHFALPGALLDDIQIGSLGPVDFHPQQLFQHSEVSELNVAVLVGADVSAPVSPAVRHALAGATVLVEMAGFPMATDSACRVTTAVRAESAKLHAGVVLAAPGFGESSTDATYSGLCLIAEDGKVLESAEDGCSDIVTELDVQLLIAARRKDATFTGDAASYVVTEWGEGVEETVLTRPFGKYPYRPDDPADYHAAAKRLLHMQAASLVRRMQYANLKHPVVGISGGVDSTALYPPKRFLGAARNIEHGGSLTILASALVDTGSKMDEVIFEEFKGTGNMELKLDRNLADRRIFPAIDPVASGTRKEDLLLEPQEAPLIWAVRRILANTNSTERAMDMLIKSLKQTETNQEFLVRTAKKAQHTKADGSLEF